MTKTVWIAGVAAAALLIGGATAVAAQSKDRNTPQQWSYQIKDGKRVPRAERKVNEDGSWTETRRVGNCTITREGRKGEVRETRSCDSPDGG